MEQYQPKLRLTGTFSKTGEIVKARLNGGVGARIIAECLADTRAKAASNFFFKYLKNSVVSVINTVSEADLNSAFGKSRIWIPRLMKSMPEADLNRNAQSAQERAIILRLSAPP